MPVARILSALGATVLFSFIPASLPPAQAQNVALPRMGDGAELTANDERRLGDSIIRQLYRDPDYIDDPVVHSYVMGIWYPLKEAAALPRGTAVIYLGWLCAGGIKGLKGARRRFRTAAVCAVGMAAEVEEACE